ncbi:MAG: dTMP kinase [Candidatus Limnocylindrales bacterium]
MQTIASDNSLQPGIFVTFEGPDGAGKSSQQALLTERIRQLGREVVATREPGGTELGEGIRGVLLEASEAHDPIVDALLFNAARRALVDQVIRPALARGAVVVCDRFADSTLAYQGYGAGVPVETLRSLAEVATQGLRPTRTVLLDISVEAGLTRRRGGPADELTRFETSTEHDGAFHQRVRAGYLALAAVEPDRWRVVDGSGAADEVADRVWAAVGDLFG